MTKKAYGTMKLTFINPPQNFSKYQGATGIVLLLGLAYLASYAKE